MDKLPVSTELTDLSVAQFLDTLASESPTPGGGSVSALAGALGAALAGMVARLTFGRPRYAAVEDEMRGLVARADALRTRLSALVVEDAQAYDRVSAAYRLPKQTPDEQARRSAAIQEALARASETPLQVAEACAGLLDVLPALAAHGNRNAADDAAVGALLAHAGLEGALRNVMVNLKSLKDETTVRRLRARAAALQSAGEAQLAAALAAADGEG